MFPKNFNKEKPVPQTKAEKSYPIEEKGLSLRKKISVPLEPLKKPETIQELKLSGKIKGYCGRSGVMELKSKIKQLVFRVKACRILSANHYQATVQAHFGIANEDLPPALESIPHSLRHVFKYTLKANFSYVAAPQMKEFLKVILVILSFPSGDS